MKSFDHRSFFFAPLEMLESMMKMAKKKNRTEAGQAITSLSEVFQSVLPNRKLM
jgi:hypothetical protein